MVVDEGDGCRGSTLGAHVAALVRLTDVGSPSDALGAELVESPGLAPEVHRGEREGPQHTPDDELPRARCEHRLGGVLRVVLHGFLHAAA